VLDNHRPAATVSHHVVCVNQSAIPSLAGQRAPTAGTGSRFVSEFVAASSFTQLREDRLPGSNLGPATADYQGVQ
jgi:hypothetical protein